MLDVGIERGVVDEFVRGSNRHLLSELFGRAESPGRLLVTKDELAAIMRCGKDDDERSEHQFTARSIFVWFEE